MSKMMGWNDCVLGTSMVFLGGGGGGVDRNDYVHENVVCIVYILHMTYPFLAPVHSCVSLFFHACIHSYQCF